MEREHHHRGMSPLVLVQLKNIRRDTPFNKHYLAAEAQSYLVLRVKHVQVPNSKDMK